MVDECNSSWQPYKSRPRTDVDTHAKSATPQPPTISEPSEGSQSSLLAIAIGRSFQPDGILSRAWQITLCCWRFHCVYMSLPIWQHIQVHTIDYVFADSIFECMNTVRGDAHWGILSSGRIHLCSNTLPGSWAHFYDRLVDVYSTWAFHQSPRRIYSICGSANVSEEEVTKRSWAGSVDRFWRIMSDFEWCRLFVTILCVHLVVGLCWNGVKCRV